MITTTTILARWVLLSGLLVSVAVPGWAADYGSAKVARITSIYDGDTFRADIPGWPDIVGSRVPIRLAGADTPKLRASCDREKHLARQAKQYTVSALRNAQRIELRHIDRGKYFRLVAEVWVDGQRLGPSLIQRGLARPYDGGHKQGWC